MPFPTSSFAQSGAFTNIQEIAQSADAVIYEAQDAVRRRTVAVKAMIPGVVDPQRVQLKLIKEARILKGLRHDNIIAYYDLLIDPQSGERYLVCEYADAGSLAARLQAQKQLPEREAIAITLQVCAALESLVPQQIVHRDLKPSNILLCHGAQGGLVAKLGDFGVADDHYSQTGTMRAGMHYPGTPHYMAPEQGNVTNALDVRTDLYALGLVLGEMLAGKPYKLIMQGKEQLRTHAPQASAGIVAVVAKATETDIAHRYQRPAELAEDLRRVSSGQPPMHARQRRKSRAPALFGGVLLAVAAVALALFGLLSQGQDRPDPVAQAPVTSILSAADTTATALVVELQQAANQATIQALEITQAADRSNADATATANALILAQADADATATAEVERAIQAQADADATATAQAAADAAATAEALAAEANARQQAVRAALVVVDGASNEATLAAEQARQAGTTEAAASARSAAGSVHAAVDELMRAFEALEQLGSDAVSFDLQSIPSEASQALAVADQAEQAAGEAEQAAQVAPPGPENGTSGNDLPKPEQPGSGGDSSGDQKPENSGWVGNLRLGESSKTAPAMAVFGGQLCVSFVADNPSNDVLVSCSPNGVIWQGNGRLGESSKTAPAMAVFGEAMLVIFVADNASNDLLITKQIH